MVNIYSFLKSKGVEVYFIGQHTGDAITNYVVLKEDSTNGQNGSNIVGSQIADIILYAPQNKFTSLLAFRKTIKTYLKELDFLRYTGNETGIITDDSVKGLTCSIMYEIQKEL
jgi:hypothetical protein